MKRIKELRISYGPLLAIIVLLGVLWSGSQSAAYLTRLGLDFVLPFAEQDTAMSRDVVMVVIDEDTHQSVPFSETPEVAWTPFLGEVIQGVADAGASVIGLDIIYPKTLSGPDLLPGFDRPFLSALFNVGREGRLVLGKTRLSEEPIKPYEGQILAVGGEQNILPLQLTPDADGVVRSYAATFALEDGGSQLSFANELVKRAGHAPVTAPFLLDYMTDVTIPAYRLSDMLACVSSQADLSSYFAGKIVLFGVALNVEDRHVASNRFVASNQPEVLSLSCAADRLDVEGDDEAVPRQNVPGVTIHARAVQTILTDSAPVMLSDSRTAFLSGLVVAVLGFLYLRIPPIWGFAALITALAGVWFVALAMLREGIVLPYLPWAIAAVLSYILLYTYRVFFENREKRWIRHAFRHYLSPALVDQLADDPSMLKLGGESRHVAVLFLDLAGFTKASETLVDQPETLVGELNRYLAEMADIIEEHGGYVDKFIGDAVMAMWGAPVPNAQAEDAAARAALACQDAMVRINKGISKPYIRGMRIGLNSGDAVIGNMGSEHRFNYTAVGDAVNLAARLESANKNYGTTILAGEDFVAHLSDAVTRREIDYVKVAGRQAPVHIFEIQAYDDQFSPKITEQNNHFAHARAAFHAQNFETAEAEFAKLQGQDAVAAVYVKRCQSYRKTPPDPSWDGSYQLDSK